MTPAAPAPQQLTLPLGQAVAAARTPCDERLLPPQAVWASLSPTLQTQVYQTVLRIAAQVVHDAACA
jgi:hypothetical protein